MILLRARLGFVENGQDYGPGTLEPTSFEPRFPLGAREQGCFLQQGATVGIDFCFTTAGCGSDKMPVLLGVHRVWKASSL